MGHQTCHRRCWSMTGLFSSLLVLLLVACQMMTAVEGADQLKELKVQCSRSGLTVHVRFSEPFYGIIYSQDFYQVAQCTYVTSETSNGRTSFSFNVPQKGCGTVSQSKSAVAQNAFQRALEVQQQQQQPDGQVLENTIIIQHDPDFQEAGDTARRLRCVWGAQSLQKSVVAKMAEVYQPSLITVKFDYRSVNRLVEVQPARGGPLSLPARGFINNTPAQSSMAIYLKNPGQRFDANILSCFYLNGKTGENVKLTDEDGCSIRPDLTTAFYKMKEVGNPNSDLTLYTYFRGLKAQGYFAISCNVEICFNNRCGERCRNRIV